MTNADSEMALWAAADVLMAGYDALLAGSAVSAMRRRACELDMDLGAVIHFVEYNGSLPT